MMRLDKMLARLWAGLDIRSGRVALAITSNRGAGKPPARGHYTIEQLRQAANNAASLELGGGDWIAWIQPPTIALTPGALARPKGDLKKAMRKVIYALQAFPELDVVDRADGYEGNCDGRAANDKALCLALDPARSGDFVFTPKPGWIIDSEAAPGVPIASSLDGAERLVPVLLRGFTKTADGKPMMTAPSGEMSASELTSILRSWLAE
jgi:hypothetical protein